MTDWLCPILWSHLVSPCDVPARTEPCWGWPTGSLHYHSPIHMDTCPTMSYSHAPFLRRRENLLWNSATANDQIAEYGLVSENQIATVASKLFLLMLARKRLLIVGIHCSDFMAWAAHLYKLTTCIWKKKANRKKSTTMNHPYKYGPCQEIFSVNNPYNQGSCEIAIVHHCYK